jgi:hypothetical protein
MHTVWTYGEGDMALIRTLKHKPRERYTLHDEIEASYTSFERDGRFFFQLDTYGRKSRQVPGMRALIDYYTDANNGGDGKILLIAETGRRLDRVKSGDKSGRSILGTALRAKVLNTSRTKPALILLQQEGGRDLGWTAHHFWWPVFAAPSDAEPCVFATKTAT